MTARSATFTQPNLVAFAFAACAAFAVDVTVLLVMTGLGYEPLSSRLAGMGLGLVVGWAINRTWTYGFRGPPVLAEIWHYVASGAVAMLANYAAFVLVLILWPDAPPALALGFGYAVAICTAVVGYCRYVFRAQAD